MSSQYSNIPVYTESYILSFALTLYQTTFFDWSKLNTFADYKINVTEKLKFVFGRVENIVGKGENAGYQHFLLFPQSFKNFLSQGRSNS